MAERNDRREALADGFWVGDWFAEPLLNRVTKQDAETPVQVEPKVMEVLLCMAEQPGKTVTKDAFMRAVWADTVVTDDVLSRCISELRKTFGDDARNPDYIETIRKVGYRLIAPVTVPDTAEDASVVPAAPKTASAPSSASAHPPDDASVVAGGAAQRHWVAGLFGLALVLAVIGTLFFVRPRTPDAPTPPSATPFTSFPGQEIDPALSPNGRQLVFAWDRDEGDYHNLYLMQEAAEKPLRLTTAEANEWSPTWSPDGRSIAFVRQMGDTHGIYVVSSLGGNERKVAAFTARKVQGVTWAPDTTRQTLVLALQRAPHRAYGLYRLTAGVDSLVPLTRPPTFSVGDTHPAFSPDGRFIAFTRTIVDDVQDVYVVPTTGGPARRVTSDSARVSGLTWMPDGNELLVASYRSGRSGLWRIPVRDGPPTWVTTASEGTSLHHPSLDRRGRRLVYAQQASQVNLWKVSHPTDYARLTTTRLVSSTQRDADPTVSPDGERIAFASRRSGYPEIWTATAEGTAPTQLTAFEGPLTHSPRWSPGGTQIAFVSRAYGNGDVFVVSADGGPPRRLTSSPAEDLAPRWSHDGRAIYFASNRTGDWETWRAPVRGDSTTQITEGGGLAAQESPDGRVLYFVRPDTTGLWAVSLSDVTFPFPVAPARNDTLPNLLAQNALASAAAGGPASFPDLTAWPDLQRDVIGRDSVRKPAHIAMDLAPSDHANWIVDERGIYFLRRDRDTAMLSFYRFSTQRVDALFLLPDADPAGGLAVSPEGDWFLHTQEERHESDILLVKDFHRR